MNKYLLAHFINLTNTFQHKNQILHMKSLNTLSLVISLLMLYSCGTETTVKETEQSETCIKEIIDSSLISKQKSVELVADSVNPELIPDSLFGYYRAFVPASYLLDEKGNKMIVANNPVQVPANVLYIRIFRGTAYGVQASLKNRFLFTGPYSYADGSDAQRGSLLLMLNGKYLKTGKNVGEWTPVIDYKRKKDGGITLTLKGASGSPDVEMKYFKRDVDTFELQSLMDKEVKNL